MAEMIGRGVALKIGTEYVATCTSKSLTINNEVLDITSDGDKGIQRMLGMVGKKSVELSVEGNFSPDKTALANSLMAKALQNGAYPNCDTSIIEPLTFEFYISGCVSVDDEPDFTISGEFAIASFALTAATAEVVTFSASFNSSGQVLLTAGTTE